MHYIMDITVGGFCHQRINCMNDGPGRLPRMPECPFTLTELLRYYSYPTQPNVDIVHVGNYQPGSLFISYLLPSTYVRIE